jgi:hypothetical protein
MLEASGIRTQIILPPNDWLPRLTEGVDLSMQPVIARVSPGTRSILEMFTIIPSSEGLLIAAGGRTIKFTHDGATYSPPDSARTWDKYFRVETSRRPYGIIFPDQTQIVVVQSTV